MKLTTNGEDVKCSKCGKIIKKGDGYYAFPKGPVCSECVPEEEKKK